ncbi:MULTISPECIES: pyridoxal phosphate-dependent aminotransferase [Alteromonadaceae]|uniref:pyridoxal phosphate-dependent aminotransferase n=1 Tax=Alteromonadaceae TaxID=72275 RepID=UPI001C0A5424|nr:MULTISPECIES: histidinol-phosphate transaminase [Aliiglaciecola]MBU2876516.1 histidinol-phosphate aminotransferase family protein [Aliiglaciecola lipolytica]MDO6711549.1 histidinol-phosphate transaminase [Aliiglaciecola sp. 2_MG-2023]MDO6752475.1 histidinol-phosphate transaminase [Aliiglaciecola sp. 1_MG-2023]
MTYNPSRRLFLGGSIAASAAGASGLIVPAGLASAATSPAPKVSYGPAAGIAKLNANENPYGPSPEALKAISQASSQGGAYYAYNAGMYLRDMIAENYNLKPGNISITAGSSLILAFAALAATTKGVILGPDLFWDTTSKAPISQGGPDIRRVANTADLEIDLDALYDAIDDNVAMVHVCNPNNPTGRILDPMKLKEFCIKASKKTLVLVDEAYNELIEDGPKHSMIPLINQGHNIIVARTFSKIYGLAGMRVGYMLGSEENIEFINRYGLGGYSINQAGLAAAIASYHDEGFKTFSRDKVMEAKGIIQSAVKANGLTALPSSTNFVFVNLGENGDANAFRKAMEKQNVLIRGQYRTYKPWSRVSTGIIKDVQMYADAMPKALDEMYKMMKS